MPHIQRGACVIVGNNLPESAIASHGRQGHAQRHDGLRDHEGGTVFNKGHTPVNKFTITTTMTHEVCRPSDKTITSVNYIGT